MADYIIIIIILVLVILGLNSCKKHFSGQGGCCGSGSTPVPKQRKKLKYVIAKKTFIIEGMVCDHCKNRVERSINAIDGAAAKVNLSKKAAVVSLETDVADEVIRCAIEKAGYKVTEIR